MRTAAIVLHPFLKADYAVLISWIDSPRVLLEFAGPHFTYPLTAAQLDLNVSDTRRHPFMAVDSHTGEKVGYAECYFLDQSTVKVARVFIAARYRGMGNGTALLQSLLQFACTQCNAKRVVLNVFEHNKAAMTCYTKLGFVMQPNVFKRVDFEGETWRSVGMMLPLKSPE
ncbi:GNAT family N-acetyltransferase [Flavobacterium sedimenticola]|uniref:GNAT family protein n=1 Tax=Flavobacterium sedimenticola TaxID=3043286 RepID=A0ABT6XT57_9FLAO|nr:GNAT family protein [Flavobacterium sedimenticola]MDI9258165.1 GNAT family protein [Flavobacterium sedimenticola]